MNKHRTQLLELIDHIEPYDELERKTLGEVAAWIASGQELYRGEAQDLPDPHLVVYFVLVDLRARKILLVNHIKAGLWLPTGGHVEVDEGPGDAVKRELAEELGPRVAQSVEIGSMPLFVTSTRTRGGETQHTDVSLWYVVAARADMVLQPDSREFKSVRWYGFDEVLGTDSSQLDPQMHRFTRKLATSLET